MISRQRLTPLLKRAAMSIYEWNTQVIRSTDKTDRRICVSSNPIDRLWADCISLQINNVDKTWSEIAVLSPARARLLAEQLILKAEAKEALEKCTNIDESY